MQTNKIFTLILGFIGILTLLFLNPIEWNEAGYRTIVTRIGGSQFVQIQPGAFYAGFFSKSTEWPNQLTVSYREEAKASSLDGSSMEIGKIPVRFSGGPEADIMGIVQFILPNDEQNMLNIHNAHKTPEHLVSNRLMPYTRECLQSSAQLQTVEYNYGGGRAQLAQDYLDQLQNGAYLLEVKEVNIKDSVSGEFKTTYKSFQKKDSEEKLLRKYSSIKEYSISVADAQITDYEYSTLVKEMINKNIESVTRASVSRQNLVTAQQEALTAKAAGERELVTIEYEKKKEQTAHVVAAQTQVELAKQDLIKQEIARQAAEKEAAKIKTLADAEAYSKQKIMAADGALEKKLNAWVTAQEFWANAFSKYQGNIVPQISTGSGANGGNAAVQFMEIMGMRAARDLNLDLKNK